MFVWLKWRLVGPMLALVMALAPVACVLHCQVGSQVRMAPPKAILLGEKFMPDCGMSASPTNHRPLGEMQQTYEQVTLALAPASIMLMRAVAPAQARRAVMPILRGITPSPEVPPPKNYK